MKTFRTISLLISLFLCMMPLAGQSKKYEPLTTWPYLYEEFRPGRLTTWQGAAVAYDSLNVNLVSGRAHYIQNGTIMETDPNTVALLVIGEDSFVRAEGRMVKVLRNTEHAAVVLSMTVDAEAMNRTSIGYGTSAIASTQNVSLNAITGGMDYSSHRSLDAMVRDRYNGEKLAVREVKGILFQGMFIPASRADILKIPGIDKDAVKKYIKNEKIRFSDIGDLARLTEFLYSL